MSCDCCGAGRVETNTREGKERSGGGAIAKAAEELEEDVVGSRVSDVLVFPSSVRVRMLVKRSVAYFAWRHFD